MMDLLVVHPKEVISLSKVTEVGQGLPRVFELVGEDFRAADKVYFNGDESPSFVILGKKKLLAQVPVQLTYERIVSAEVLSNKLTLSSRSRLQLTLGTAPRMVTGMLRLLQLFLKILLTSPGTDAFSPRIGGGFGRIIGAPVEQRAAGGLVADAVASIKQAEEQVKAVQAGNRQIPLAERLLSAQVESTGYNKTEQLLQIKVILRNMAGQVGLANVDG